MNITQQNTIRTPAYGTPLLTMRHVRRTFGKTVALADCSIEITSGEIHALVGENGSGKSTLIKILSGILRPDSGDLLWVGNTMAPTGPAAAQELGIGTVFQETLVVDGLSVRDNVMLGIDRRIRRKAKKRAEAEAVLAVLADLGLEWIDTETPVGSLSLAQRQMIGIARSLARPWRLLILDESTSALDIGDRDRLFALLRRFRGEGRSVLFVTHRMDEIQELADRATVLRSGTSVASMDVAEAPIETLLKLMTSQSGARAGAGVPAPRVRPAVPPVLSARGVALAPGRGAWDIDVRPGEILGLAGLEGHGQETFLEAAAGLRRLHAGELACLGNSITHADVARAQGIAFLPRDRKSQGVFAPLSVADNVLISSFHRFGRFGFLPQRRVREVARRHLAEMLVKAADLDAPIASLSGGNQQKVLLGRLIATRPRILALNDPMRGVDLGAKRDLYELLNRQARDGMAVILLSTELVELCLLCDRVAVFHDQHLSSIVERADLSEAALIAAMFLHPEKGANA